MAIPSRTGAPGQAGPIPDPLKTGSVPRSAIPSSSNSPAPDVPAGMSESGGRGERRPGQAAPSAGVQAPSAGIHESARTAGSAPDISAGMFESGDRREQRPGQPPLSAGVKETAQTAAEAVRQQASQFAADVGHELGKTGEAQKARGVEAIRRFARAIDSAADELEGDSPVVARTVHQAAHQVSDLSDNLSSRNVNELIESATQLARTQPALFIGGSVAAGFALARFLKSSARQRPGAGYDPYQR
jgi:hypothetical protein